MSADWSRTEVEAIVADYLDMLAAELAGVPFSKSAHRQGLLPKLDGRSPASIEYKHQNISAALIDLGFPHIVGYRARANYQRLLLEVVEEHVHARPSLRQLAAEDVKRSMIVPDVRDPLTVLAEPPQFGETGPFRLAAEPSRVRPLGDYLEREARNRSLGQAGELFVLTYESERLHRAGRDDLVQRIEHVSATVGDGAGFDVRSFDVDGRDRLIEVKTTRYGIATPFFLSRNELEVSERRANEYHLYRLYAFRSTPRMYTLAGAITRTCSLSATTFAALPK